MPEYNFSKKRKAAKPGEFYLREGEHRCCWDVIICRREKYGDEPHKHDTLICECSLAEARVLLRLLNRYKPKF